MKQAKAARVLTINGGSSSIKFALFDADHLLPCDSPPGEAGGLVRAFHHKCRFRQLQHWLEVESMTERIYSALDDLTPAEFEAAALGQPIPLL